MKKAHLAIIIVLALATAILSVLLIIEKTKNEQQQVIVEKYVETSDEDSQELLGVCPHEIAMVELTEYFEAQKARDDERRITDYSFELQHDLDIIYSDERFVVGVEFKVKPADVEAYTIAGSASYADNGWVEALMFANLEKHGDKYEIIGLSTGVFHKPYQG